MRWMTLSRKHFCAISSFLHSYDFRYSFHTWLWTTLLNPCHRATSRVARRPWRNWIDQSNVDGAALDLPAHVPDRQVSPLRQLLDKERTEMIERLLGEIKGVQADALCLAEALRPAVDLLYESLGEESWPALPQNRGWLELSPAPQTVGPQLDADTTTVALSLPVPPATTAKPSRRHQAPNLPKHGTL